MDRMATRPAHETVWAQTLLACIQEMAERQSNPVLELLDGAEEIRAGQRYPEASLYFAHNQWRAFYHCHDAPNKAAAEHGHFHLFTRRGDSWAHAAGLSMDRFGQPLDWFVVNRWVTGGPWLPRDELIGKLDSEHYDQNDPLVGRWAACLLQVYRSVLLNLSAQRDRQLHAMSHERSLDEISEDRNIYLLASKPLHIRNTLEAWLSALGT